MKALVYEGVKSMAMRDVQDPVAGPGTQLIRIEAVGICGSDMHAYLGHDERRPAPLILGHEAAGVIVGGPRDGKRVTVNPMVTCGTCPACQAGRENLCPHRQLISMPPRQGAFAQYVVMPDANLVEVPDHVALEVAALAEPMSVSWHAALMGLKALQPSMDRRALVLGGGAIGVTSALCLRAMGLEDVTVVEPTDSRRAFVTDQVGLNAVSEANGMYPLVIDAVGYGGTRAVASAQTEPGGVIVHVGLGDSAPGYDIRRATLQEITLIGTYCYTYAEFRDCAQAMFDGRLGALDWFEQRPLVEGAQAFADLLNHAVAAPKIVLTPWA